VLGDGLGIGMGDRQASAVRKTGGTVWRRRSVATHLGQDGRDEAPCEKLEENDDGNVVDVRLRRPAAALCWKWGVEGGAAGERERGQCQVCAWGLWPFFVCAAVELFFGGFLFSWIFGLGRTMGGAAAVSVGLSASSTSTAEYRGRRVRQKHSIVRTTRLSMAGGEVGQGWGSAAVV